MQFEEWIIYGYEGSYDFIIQIVIVNEEGDILHVKDTFECSCRGLLFINAFGVVSVSGRRRVPSPAESIIARIIVTLAYSAVYDSVQR